MAKKIARIVKGMSRLNICERMIMASKFMIADFAGPVHSWNFGKNAEITYDGPGSGVAQWHSNESP